MAVKIQIKNADKVANFLYNAKFNIDKNTFEGVK